MTKYSFIKTGILLAILLWGTIRACAQNYENSANKLFGFVTSGQGDSVYVYLNDNVRSKVTPEIFNNVFNQLEKQFGKYQSKGEWQSTTVNGQNVYFCDLKFEHSSLRFLTAFDPDGKANTIRFVPTPPTESTPATPVNNKKFTESAIEIVSGKFKLPGTLSSPKEVVKPPVAILVHGSGPNDRDETIGPNKPFRDLAWGLANKGIAVIRYDKRTFVYGSQWEPASKSGTFDDETVEDALAAINWAKKDPLLDADHIYIIGHSLGGMLAPRIAQQAKTLAGIIILSGNARPLEEVILDQVNYLSSLKASSDKSQEQINLITSQVDNLEKLGTSHYNAKIGLPFNFSKAYWLFAKKYKQVQVASKLKLPILILQGERDYQVTMKDFNIWHSKLIYHKNVTFKSYPKLNHLYQEGVGKSVPAEYAKIASIPEYVLQDIASWIKDKKISKKTF